MLTQTIKSYLYQEYADDADIQAFVREYNNFTQLYIDWFNQVGLPVYSGTQITNLLLDWVGEGIYGLPRPVLSNGLLQDIGPLGTWELGTVSLGSSGTSISAPYYPTTDDIYKRILTWRLYRSDGFVFSIEWLKKRVMRFLNGANGTAPDIDNTYSVSVKFNPVNNIVIGFNQSTIAITDGCMGTMGMGELLLGGFDFSIKTYPGNQYLQYLISALNAGVLDLPFQYKFTIVH